MNERDYSKEKPAPDIVFQSYRRMYDYDPTLLSAKTDFIDSSAADWTVERVSYAAAYGGERIPAILMLPKRAKPPYQVVVYFPGSNAIHTSSSAGVSPQMFDFILRSGRAVLHPIYKSTYERRDSLSSDYADESIFYRDHVLMWGKDFRRSVDYISSRKDLDSSLVAYYGVSWGGFMGGILPAIEPRIKAVILYVAGLGRERAKPEVDPINFLPRVRQPTLMLNGKYDHFFPIESAQKPFFALLGTPAEHKRYVVYEGGHNVPRERLISETLQWLDKYLGAPR
jgi:eukaryotic-like serine/threonine-protein kinase